jgi:hypothetical protein
MSICICVAVYGTCSGASSSCSYDWPCTSDISICRCFSSITMEDWISKAQGCSFTPMRVDRTMGSDTWWLPSEIAISIKGTTMASKFLVFTFSPVLQLPWANHWLKPSLKLSSDRWALLWYDIYGIWVGVVFLPKILLTHQVSVGIVLVRDLSLFFRPE